jgi:hypothetical protein
MANIILVINDNYHILLYLYKLTIGQGYTKVSIGWSVQLYQNAIYVAPGKNTYTSLQLRDTVLCWSFCTQL